MSEWKEIYRDSDQVIEQRIAGEAVEQRQTWLTQTTDAQVQQLVDAVDTLILDALGGDDV